MILWLADDSLEFPPLEQALVEPDGLLAAGGDLSEARLLHAYRNGIFPWYNPGEPILWWSPDPRCVLFPNELYLSRSLRKRLRKQDYRVTFDQAFAKVVAACAAPRRGQEGTWISDDIFGAYLNLHHQGHAHSVEVWIGDELVGGLYGLAIGRVFFGESMFSRQRDASKIAFAWLAHQLQYWGYELIDCQVYNDHLASLGATEIPRQDFTRRLEQLRDTPVCHAWSFAISRDDITGARHE
ncbi:leucyl/phenylalanyl-tRNA--protein transferase [Marinobacterium weihaiense]|uniref:Leucyl/phenylalanyl-tRNA--protein transferase n=1 Tax=Marinobacterium weihaiense TaxID=2851016 RepID=A0ABS6M6C7_9GAMM|nr:leucyl/phenylalanyl-tRNA--protein transferase [Marinobacterium weihaiense]MBV0931780.1 leucyl/phenylalanyl-tRNA--protein transferase [Marinobacterium weihaiense]